MADGFDIKISGLDEIEKRLQALPEKLRRKSIRKALQDGAEIVRAEAALRVPKRKPAAHGWESFVERDDEPHLRDNITKKVTVGANGASARVGIDYKKVRHGHLVEFGHEIVFGRRAKKGEKNTQIRTGRRTRKFPFMRPAFDTKGDKAVDIIVTELAEAVEEEI